MGTALDPVQRLRGAEQNKDSVIGLRLTLLCAASPVGAAVNKVRNRPSFYDGTLPPTSEDHMEKQKQRLASLQRAADGQRSLNKSSRHCRTKVFPFFLICAYSRGEDSIDTPCRIILAAMLHYWRSQTRQKNVPSEVLELQESLQGSTLL